MMKDWEIVVESIALFSDGLFDMAAAEIDFELEAFTFPDAPEFYWDFHANLREWLDEAEFLRRELIWMEFNLDTPERADRFRRQIKRALAVTRHIVDWPLLGREAFGRRAARVQKELELISYYCQNLHDFIIREMKKADRQKKSSVRPPQNPLVVRLADEIRKRSPKGEHKKKIAREIADGNEKAAESLLRQLRPSRHGHILEDGGAADT
jgi:hypothetical protein